MSPEAGRSTVLCFICSREFRDTVNIYRNFTNINMCQWHVSGSVLIIVGLVILWVTAGGRFKKWLDDRRARAAMDDIRAQLARMRETEGSDQSPAADNNTNVCVICLTNNRDICNRPCGHVCSCVTCYEAMPAPRKCPVCREAIVSILPVYLP